MKPPFKSSNRILSRLTDAEFALLEPRLTLVDLPVRKNLEVSRKPIEFIYFPESGIVSVVANGNNKTSIEVGLIGREGSPRQIPSATLWCIARGGAERY